MIETGKIPVSWSADFINFNYTAKNLTPYDNVLEFIDNKDFDRYITAGCYYNGEDIKERLKLKDNFKDLKHTGYTVHKLCPGQIFPYHKDCYTRYKKLYNVKNVDSIKRIIVFLRDWNLGELLGVEDKIFTNWKAGDWVSWTGGTTHIAANLGHTDRYTLQITGLKE